MRDATIIPYSIDCTLVQSTLQEASITSWGHEAHILQGVQPDVHVVPFCSHVLHVLHVSPLPVGWRTYSAATWAARSWHSTPQPWGPAPDNDRTGGVRS